MTEADAKTKWCPQTQVQWLHFDQMASNQPHGFRGEINCIGSACMMWRGKTKTETTVDGQAIELPIDDGFCGLAGKP